MKINWQINKNNHKLSRIFQDSMRSPVNWNKPGQKCVCVCVVLMVTYYLCWWCADCCCVTWLIYSELEKQEGPRTNQVVCIVPPPPANPPTEKKLIPLRPTSVCGLRTSQNYGFNSSRLLLFKDIKNIYIYFFYIPNIKFLIKQTDKNK